MTDKTKKNGEKIENHLTDGHINNPYTSMLEFWQKYSTAWMEKYQEFVDDIQRIGELQRESLTNIERMNELYKDLVESVEKMSLLYKESLTITQRMTKYWIDYQAFFQKEKDD
ncbi:MAG: hypothetical protein ACE5SW_13365 [Nitrososphaeraceae archaeon]